MYATQIAAFKRQKRFFPTGVRSRDITKRRCEVIPVYTVIKKNTWFAISPYTFNYLSKYSPYRNSCFPVPDFFDLIAFNKFHESIRDHNRDIEITQLSFDMLC